jgi:cellulase
MLSSAITFALLGALTQNTAAHGIVTGIIIGTKTYQGYDPNFQYMPTPPAVIGWTAPQTQDRGPVDANNYANPDIICQRGATNAKISAEVAAGDKVSLKWTEWPSSHHGPMLDYLADCGADCSTVDKTKLKFFKIDGVGMTGLQGVSVVLRKMGGQEANL